MANSLNITNIPAPRVPFIDERTGLMAREWYRFFLNLFVLTGSGNNPITLEELQLGPPNQPDFTELLIQINQNIAPQYEDQSGDFLATLDTAQLMSMMSRFENAEAAIQGAYLQPPQLPVDGVYVVGPGSSTDNAVARFDGTTGKLIQNSVTTIDDTGNASGILSQQFSDGTAVTLAAGKMWYDGTTGAWNAGMGNGNITQQIGEEIFVYGKASAAVTDSPLQIVYHTGVVGASGVIKFAPTIAGITDVNAIIGVATESLALNGFGRATVFGVVRGITTNGTAFGEVWADDDVIWYNPVTGNPTKVEPVAPYIKVQVGLVIKAGAGGSGSFQVNIARGSKLGGTDSNVQFGTLANNNLIAYDSTAGYWKNVTASAIGLGTVTSVSVVSANGLAGTVATATTTPAITLSTTVTGLLKGNGTAISAATSGTDYAPATSGTSILYGNGAGGFNNVTIGTGVAFTAGTLSATGSGGTVTSVTGTAPVVSSGGATPAISMAAATTSVNGYLTSTDWNTFNGKGSGTVTSVAALTLGTTGTDLSSTVANGTTTPVITLQVPTASASNRGALSAADWTTFNNKGSGTVTSVSGTGTVNGITLTGTVTSSGSLTLGGTLSGVSLTTQVSGTLPTANGGTNLTSFTSGGVVYASSASALATGSVLVFDGANLGLGVTPSAWGSPYKALQVGATAVFGGHTSANRNYLSSNVYWNGSAYKYITTSQATQFEQSDGAFYWLKAASGTAGDTISFALAMELATTGILTIGAYGAGAATFSASGVISSVSDETWKVKDGAPVDTDAMLNKLEPGYWYYNDEKKDTFGNDRQLGFYAQNVNAAIGPEAAPEPEEGKPWGYYDRSVLAVTVMSLQKALATIQSLTARIAALESK